MAVKILTGQGFQPAYDLIIHIQHTTYNFGHTLCQRKSDNLS